MKRDVALRGLSEQHQHGLFVARGLRLAEDGTRELSEALEAMRATWLAEMEPHFQAEELTLVPAAAASIGADHPWLARLLRDHAEIRGAWEGLQQSPTPEAAGHLGRMLDQHIRFEERELFPMLESRLSADAMAKLGALLPHQPGKSCRTNQER